MHAHHGHEQDEGTHGAHGPGAGVARRLSGRLIWSLVATIGLVVAELGGGLASHSIALIADGVHNLTDLPMIAISWLAVRWAERPPTSEKTYGYHRAGILAAFTNSVVLLLVSGFLAWASYQRFLHPESVHAPVMLALGAVALAINGGITLALARGRSDLNLRAVLVHNLGDALSNIGILAGGVAIQVTGARWVDPAIGMAIAAMVLWAVIGILRESSHILLEGLPKEMSLEDIARTILTVAPVQEVHDIHVWTLGTGRHVLSCHIRIPDMQIEQTEWLLEQINERLARDFRIHHTTIQFERVGLAAESGLYMPAPFDSGAQRH